MQHSLFTPNHVAVQEERYAQSTGHDLFSAVDERTKASEESGYSRWYCVKAILCEQYLWDMRCWEKPRYLYTKPEVAAHIQKWLNDDEGDNWTCNCTGCLYCMRTLLEMKWASLDVIAGFVMRNNNVSYSGEIGSWGNGFVEDEDEEEYTSEDEAISEHTLECGNCGRFIDENEEDILVSETKIRCGRCMNL